MPRANAIRHRKQRVRNKKVDFEPDAVDQKSIILPEELKFTYNGDLFLKADSGKEENRILIFSTDSNLELLS